jgi:hypothetical protein
MDSLSERWNRIMGRGTPSCPLGGGQAIVLRIPRRGSCGHLIGSSEGYTPCPQAGGCHPAPVREYLKDCCNRTKTRGVNAY